MEEAKGEADPMPQERLGHREEWAGGCRQEPGQSACSPASARG